MAVRKKLGEVLLEAGLIDEVQLEAALSHQRSWGGPLGRIMIESGFVTEQKLVEALSHLLGVPRVELARREIPPALLEEVPLDFAEKFNLVPVALRSEAKGEVLYVAMSDPTNLDAIDTLQFKTGKRVAPMIAAESEVEGAIRRFYYGERRREREPESLENVQYPGQQVTAASFAAEPVVGQRGPAGLGEDEIPVVTGATLLEQEPAPANDPNWFLQVEEATSSQAEPPPSSTPVPASAAAPSPVLSAPATLSPTPSSPFAAASPLSSPGFPTAKSAPETGQTPAPAGDLLFGAPNSFLGRDDEMGLGQSDRKLREASAETPVVVEPLPNLSDVSTRSLPELLPAEPLPAEAADPPLSFASVDTPYSSARSEPALAAPSAAESSAALPVATSRPDDDESVLEVQPLDLDVVGEPLSLDEEDDSPLELATAADFLHGGPPLSDLPERGLALEDDDGEPFELASAAELIASPDAGTDAGDEDDDAPLELADSVDDGPMLLATAAELAQMTLESDARPTSESEGEASTAPELEDLSELRDLALARLEEIGDPDDAPAADDAAAPTSELAAPEAVPSPTTSSRAPPTEAPAEIATSHDEAAANDDDVEELELEVDVDVPVEQAAPMDAVTAESKRPAAEDIELVAAAEAPTLESARLPAAELGLATASAHDDERTQNLRPLPPPGGMAADDPDSRDDGPIEVVNMPPDRRPVGFVPVPVVKAAAPPPVEDDFGNPLEPAGELEGELEALDIEGSVFDSDSGEVPAAAEGEAASPVGTPDAAAVADASETASITNDPEPTAPEANGSSHEPSMEPSASEEAVPLSASDIHEMERRHDGTTTLSSASLADAPERVGQGGGEKSGRDFESGPAPHLQTSRAGAAYADQRSSSAHRKGEVMTLALPTPAYSNASVVDAPWRLAGEAAPAGRGPTDVPLAPFGQATSALSHADDVDALMPPPVLAGDPTQSDEPPSDAVALPGSAPPSPDDDDDLDVVVAVPELLVPDTAPVSALEPANDDEEGDSGLADSWREAAESQLHQRAVPDVFEVPEHRRPFVAPTPTAAAAEPRPLHAYQPSSDAASDPGRVPWAILVEDVGKAAAEAACAEEAGDQTPAAAAETQTVDAAAPDVTVDKGPMAAEPADISPFDGVAPTQIVPDGFIDSETGSEVSPVETPAEDPEGGGLESAPVAPVEVPVAPPVAARRPAPVDEWSGRGTGEHRPGASGSSAGLPSATPRSVLVAEAVHMDDDLTPESSPPTLAAGVGQPPSVPVAAEFAPTPTMITRMNPDELRALAERLVQRGALTSDDIDAARKATPPRVPASLVSDDDSDG